MEVGERFGRLVVIGAGFDRIRVRVRCDCGEEKNVRIDSLKRGTTQSCGCLHVERARAASKTHGMSRTPLYAVWKTMNRRCDNPCRWATRKEQANNRRKRSCWKKAA